MGPLIFHTNSAILNACQVVTPRLNIMNIHMVMIFRGKESVLLGDKSHDVEAGDFIEIPGKMIHQFPTNKGDYIRYLAWLTRSG